MSSQQVSSEKQGQPEEQQVVPRSRGHQLRRYIYYLFWIPIVLPLFFVLAILFAIPYTYCSCCRPTQRWKTGKKKEFSVRDTSHDDPTKYASTGKREHRKEKYNPFMPHAPRTHLNFWGEGPEKEAKSTRTKWRMFFVQRTWEMYQSLRDFYRMISRQGLQIGGIISAYIILTFQIQIMLSDYLSDPLQEAWENPDAYKQDNDLCAYIVGTGIPLWADVEETRIWYGFYHVHICFICICLILDELFNVRMGIFAPQWSRMGHGYTIMFLSSATVVTSPNWGFTRFFRFRYFILVVIFLNGVYNWARGWLAENSLMSDKDVARTYRNRRYPLRPWTEREWFKTRNMPPFRRRARELLIEKERIKKIPGATVNLKKPKYWTERVQLALGDRSVQLEAIERDNWDFGFDGRAANTRRQKPEAQSQIERGSVVRKFWLGNPTKLPLDLRYDMQWRIDAKRGSKFKDYANFYGTHYWDPWEQINGYFKRRREDPEGQKRLENYEHYGIAWGRQRYLTLFFDVRRAHAMGCAIVMFAIHIGLLIVVFILLRAFNNGGRRYETYQEEYKKATESWKSNHGPSDDACQYYDSSTVPILVLYGVGPYSAVQQTLFWVTMWHIFILGMCIAVFAVAMGNDRYWGMHLQWPITLVGPRTSSISMGLTIGFVAWATLQLGFFADQPELVRVIVRYACYNCVLSWVAHLFKNEYMKNVVCRKPFYKPMTRYSFETMDSDLRFWEYPDYDEPSDEGEGDDPHQKVLNKMAQAKKEKEDAKKKAKGG